MTEMKRNDESERLDVGRRLGEDDVLPGVPVILVQRESG